MGMPDAVVKLPATGIYDNLKEHKGEEAAANKAARYAMRRAR